MSHMSHCVFFLREKHIEAIHKIPSLFYQLSGSGFQDGKRWHSFHFNFNIHLMRSVLLSLAVVVDFFLFGWRRYSLTSFHWNLRIKKVLWWWHLTHLPWKTVLSQQLMRLEHCFPAGYPLPCLNARDTKYCPFETAKTIGWTRHHHHLLQKKDQ